MVEVRKEFRLNGWCEKDDESKENLRKAPPASIPLDFHILPAPMDPHSFNQNVLCNNTKSNKAKIQVMLLKVNHNLTMELY